MHAAYLQVVVDAAAMECSKMIEQIRQRSAEVEQKRKLANEKNQELQVEGERISQEKKLAEEALDEALPALEAAAEALKNLKKDDITMVKSYANPPGPVKDVCQCVLELKPFGKEDPTQGWVRSSLACSANGLNRILLGWCKVDDE